MAKSKGNTEQSLITILSAAREAVFMRADTDGFRSLTDAEHVQADALMTVIATAEPISRKDVAAQVAVSRELIELVEHGLVGANRLELATVALASASRMLADRRRTA